MEQPPQTFYGIIYTLIWKLQKLILTHCISFEPQCKVKSIKTSRNNLLTCRTLKDICCVENCRKDGVRWGLKEVSVAPKTICRRISVLSNGERLCRTVSASKVDKRHDRARHTEFIKRYKQGPREEDVKEDNGEETPVKQIRGTSSNSTPQLPYYKDPRRRPIYISSKDDFALSDQHYDGIIHARSDESLTLKNTDELFFSQT